MKMHNKKNSLTISLLVLLVIISSVSCSKPEDSVACDCNDFNICVEGKCIHKPFFPPYALEIVGLVILFCGSALSNTGGIGGGGLLVPILILLLKFNTHEAIPLSKLMIFTGAVVVFIMMLQTKHPYRNAPLVDFNISGLMVPCVLFGTMLGVSFNKLFPSPVILISLTTVLIITTYKTFAKAFSLYKNETIDQNNRGEHVENSNQEEAVRLKSLEQNEIKSEDKTISIEKPKDENLHSKEYHSSLKTTHMELEKNSCRMNAILEIEYQKDARLFPWDKLGYMMIAYLILIIITLLKGSDYVKTFAGITSCSWEYWITFFYFVPCALAITYFFARKVLQEYNHRISLNYPYHSSDVKWSIAIIILYPLYAFCLGVMSGLLGVGGGLVIGPLLLEMGLHPLVTAATTNILVLFTSSSTSIQFTLNGMMNFKYGIVLVVCSTTGSCIGTFAIRKIIEKTNRFSMIVFAVASVLALSTFFLPIHALLQILHITKNVWIFGSPC